ncbi:MAG: AAA family ATPase [Alphaproteobacteria bacterium]
MENLSETAVQRRLELDNPWWGGGGVGPSIGENLPRRAFFEAFVRLVTGGGSVRPVVLMGARRMGKTVMMRQTIGHLLAQGTPPGAITYVALASPVFAGAALSDVLNRAGDGRRYLFLDGLEYRPSWHGEVAELTSDQPRLRVVAATAAAMSGRFTRLLLPPLTFAEYLAFSGRERALGLEPIGAGQPSRRAAGELNGAFIDYLNHGGFPDSAVADAAVEAGADAGQVVTGALVNDLPGLHGIADSRDLNRLFTALALNTGGEARITGLVRFTGLAKNTLKRYLDFLEAAFLIRRVHRVDGAARRFERAVTFKVYVTNPSLRAALLGPVSADDPVMGRLAETGVVSQWLHAHWAAERSAYARWPGGAVDFVELDLPSGAPQMAVDVMWDEHGLGEPEALAAFVGFARTNGVPVNYVLTRTRSGRTDIAGTTVDIEPVSRFCYRIGRQIANFSVTTGF